MSALSFVVGTGRCGSTMLSNMLRERCFRTKSMR